MDRVDAAVEFADILLRICIPIDQNLGS